MSPCAPKQGLHSQRLVGLSAATVTAARAGVRLVRIGHHKEGKSTGVTLIAHKSKHHHRIDVAAILAHKHKGEDVVGIAIVVHKHKHPKVTEGIVCVCIYLRLLISLTI